MESNPLHIDVTLTEEEYKALAKLKSDPNFILFRSAVDRYLASLPKKILEKYQSLPEEDAQKEMRLYAGAYRLHKRFMLSVDSAQEALLDINQEKNDQETKS